MHTKRRACLEGPQLPPPAHLNRQLQNKLPSGVVISGFGRRLARNESHGPFPRLRFLPCTAPGAVRCRGRRCFPLRGRCQREAARNDDKWFRKVHTDV